MEKSSANLTPVVNYPQEKRGISIDKNDFNYRLLTGSLNFLPNSFLPEAHLAVHQCAWFISNPKFMHNKSIKHILKYLKGMATQVLIIKPDPETGIEC